MKTAWILIPFALALSACAQPSSNATIPAMTADQCQFVDWREAGWRDGAAGLTQSAFDERAAICRASGVTLDDSAYFEGRVAGLQAYCAPTNGYRLGVEGAAHTNVCPPGLREEFLAEFDRGRSDRAQAGAGEWQRTIGVNTRIGVGTSGRRSGVGISIGL